MPTITKNGKVMGRPKGITKVKLNLTLDPKYKDTITKYAETKNKTISKTIEELIDKHILNSN